MLIRFFASLMGVSPTIRRRLWQIWYQLLARLYQRSDWTFMNYGYEDLSPHACMLPLQPTDEADRHSIQLYHRLVGSIDLQGAAVLEVGSGRGGGCSYITRYLKAGTMTGLDYSPTAIAFCNRVHRLANLTFRQGDAESLPFDNGAYDIVINVESSHCYGSMQGFLREVYRVLKPGGYFLWTDLRAKEEMISICRQMTEVGFLLLEDINITPNVLQAMHATSARKQQLIQTHVPRILTSYFRTFAGVEGTRVYEDLQSGETEYRFRGLRKPDV